MRLGRSNYSFTLAIVGSKEKEVKISRGRIGKSSLKELSGADDQPVVPYRSTDSSLRVLNPRGASQSQVPFRSTSTTLPC